MRRVARTRLVATLAVFLLLPVFLFLGYWQLQRAQEKRALQAEYDARASDAPVRVGGAAQRAEDLRFYRVSARGTFETDYQVLIDNRVLHGRVGYHVVTPLRIQDSEMRLLVNRGWIPQGPSREQLPPADAPTGVVDITGIATVPSEHVFMLAEPLPLAQGWERVWQHLDLKRYAGAVPFAVQPVVVLLDPDSEAGGFVREWNRLDTGVAVHQGYAFQWFALAAGLLVIYFILGRRGAGAPPQASRTDPPESDG